MGVVLLELVCSLDVIALGGSVMAVSDSDVGRAGTEVVILVIKESVAISVAGVTVPVAVSSTARELSVTMTWSGNFGRSSGGIASVSSSQQDPSGMDFWQQKVELREQNKSASQKLGVFLMQTCAHLSLCQL
jgi:hypothetical protein